MLQPRSFFRAGVLLLLLSACAAAFAPQENTAQKPEARKRIVHKSEAEIKAAAITRVEPVAPAVAQWAGVAGNVTLHLLISELGNVLDATAIDGHPLLLNAAAVAAGGWRFKPAEVEGVAVKVEGLLTITFAAGPSPMAGLPDDETDKAGEAVKVFPSSPEAHYWLGTAYTKQARYKEAETALKAAIELKPDYEEPYVYLIALYIHSQATADVLRTYQQALDKIPNSLNMLKGYAQTRPGLLQAGSPRRSRARDEPRLARLPARP